MFSYLLSPDFWSRIFFEWAFCACPARDCPQFNLILRSGSSGQWRESKESWEWLVMCLSGAFAEDNVRFVLLAIFLACYMLAGAALFQTLESDVELRQVVLNWDLLIVVNEGKKKQFWFDRLVSARDIWQKCQEMAPISKKRPSWIHRAEIMPKICAWRICFELKLKIFVHDSITLSGIISNSWVIRQIFTHLLIS